MIVSTVAAALLPNTRLGQPPVGSAGQWFPGGDSAGHVWRLSQPPALECAIHSAVCKPRGRCLFGRYRSGKPQSCRLRSKRRRESWRAALGLGVKGGKTRSAGKSRGRFNTKTDRQLRLRLASGPCCAKPCRLYPFRLVLIPPPPASTVTRPESSGRKC